MRQRRQAARGSHGASRRPPGCASRSAAHGAPSPALHPADSAGAAGQHMKNRQQYSLAARAGAPFLSGKSRVSLFLPGSNAASCEKEGETERGREGEGRLPHSLQATWQRPQAMAENSSSASGDGHATHPVSRQSNQVGAGLQQVHCLASQANGSQPLEMRAPPPLPPPLPPPGPLCALACGNQGTLYGSTQLSEHRGNAGERQDAKSPRRIAWAVPGEGDLGSAGLHRLRSHNWWHRRHVASSAWVGQSW